MKSTGSLFELCLALQEAAVARAQAAEQQVLILQRKIEALQLENAKLKERVSKLTADLVSRAKSITGTGICEWAAVEFCVTDFMHAPVARFAFCIV